MAFRAHLGERWRMREVRFVSDRVCMWECGKEVYDHVPTREDIALLLERVYKPKAITDFIFPEIVK